MAGSRSLRAREAPGSSAPRMAHLLAVVALLAIPFACAGSPPAGLQKDVTFTAYSPLASNAERMRRLLSPLTAWRMQRQLRKAHERLSDQAIDLAHEHFTLFVPTHPPPAAGYALLVFVSPWEDVREAQQWVSALDRNDTIFVGATRSGNDMDVLNRREPLALLAAYNVKQRYHVDPNRVYVGGFSGGSKVALRLALAYPDVFRGVLLEAGSEPIGTPAIPLPPAELLHRFQVAVRVVYLTGDRDHYHQREDAENRDSLRRWCVTSLSRVEAPWLAHELADAASFSRALNKLSEPARPDPEKLARCRAANEQSLQSQLQQARALMDAAKPGEARKLLEQVDSEYGGLAAPQVVTLMERLDAWH